MSDGWSNGAHQNCIWSKDLVRLSDGVLSLGFEKRKLKDREFACAEIQTKQRFGYGVYEARMKTDTGFPLFSASTVIETLSDVTMKKSASATTAR